MRTIVSTFLCLLFISTLSWSQGLCRVRHPAGPNATLVGSFRGSVSIGDDGGSRSDDGRGLLTDGKRITISQIIWVWSVSGGGTDFTLDPDSLEFVGDPSWLEENSAGALFNLLAKATVAQGIALGYTTCSSICSPTNSTVHVYIPSCVARVGTGIATRFIAQDPAVLCVREYSVCCPSSVTTPQITPILHEGTVCSGSLNGSPFQSTCP